MPALLRAPHTLLCALAALTFPLVAGAREPTEQEQFMVELINRARLDPAAEVALLGTGSLNEGPPTLGGEAYVIGAGPHQPLAIDLDLTDAASDYATLMNANDSFCHTCLGSTPESRMHGAGYVPLLSDFDFGQIAGYTGLYGTTSSGFVPGRENLSFYGEGPSNGFIDDLTAAVDAAHVGLFNDFSVSSRGHRSTMMYGEWKEIGVGLNEGTDLPGPFDSLYIVQDYARRSDTGPFLTGVAYNDLDTNGFYTPDAGEPLAGLLIEAFTAGTSTLINQTTTFTSGGYTLELPVGSYDVRFTGPGISQLFPSIDVLASGPGGLGENTKLDLVAAPAAVPALSPYALTLLAALLLLAGGIGVRARQARRSVAV